MEEKGKIDYDNINVADIMAQIRAQIAERPAQAPEDQQNTERHEQGPPQPGREGEEPSVPRSKLKRILLKIMRPFSPLIKLLVLPVYEELRRTVISLDLEEKLRRLGDSIDHGLDEANKRLDAISYELSKSRDYTKLLHNLSHNIVVELTKLKIEEETLKSKTRIIEKDFEFLEKREKAMEKQVFK